jgi:hypothetical protein
MRLNRGAYGKWRFFSKEVSDAMLPLPVATQVDDVADSRPYGFGVDYGYARGLSEFTFGHGAASLSTMRVDPVNDLVVVMTRNTAGTNYWKYNDKFMDAIVAALVDPPRLAEISEAFCTTNMDVDCAAGRLSVERQVRNETKEPVEFEYTIDVSGTSWRTEDKGSRVKIGKGPLRETIPVHKELGVGLQRKLLKRLAETTEDSGESQ